MLEAIRSAQTSVLTRATRRHILEDGILHTLFVVQFCFRTHSYTILNYYGRQ
jgi:hypothetical protein